MRMYRFGFCLIVAHNINSVCNVTWSLVNDDELLFVAKPVMKSLAKTVWTLKFCFIYGHQRLFWVFFLFMQEQNVSCHFMKQLICKIVEQLARVIRQRLHRTPIPSPWGCGHPSNTMLLGSVADSPQTGRQSFQMFLHSPPAWQTPKSWIVIVYISCSSLYGNLYDAIMRP